MRTCFLVLLFTACTLAADGSNHAQQVIDLKSIGYPQPPCDYMFQEHNFAKSGIEFLDSERLLVSFSTDTTHCNKNHTYTPSTYRSVIIDLSGKALHSFDWQRPQDVQAGPDDHILLTTGKEIRILDSDFSLLQSIPDPRSERQRMAGSGLFVDPARHGFVADDNYPSYHVSYFSGAPIRKTLEADDCMFPIAVEGGFVCWEDTSPSRFAVHVEPHAPQPDLRDRDTVFAPGLDGNRDKKWVFPGGPAWLGEIGRSISTSGRMMYFCRLTRFALTDGTGFGNVLRVIVVDTRQKRTIFRKQYPISSDVAFSPDGNWLAVREGTTLTLQRLP